MPSTEPAAKPFFVAGGNLNADAPSYVERKADRDLQAALRAGEYCYVLDSRQVGKSSLLIRAMAALRAEGIRVSSCDLQRLGSSLTAEQFYQGLLVQIGRGIGAEREMLRTWQAHKDESPFSRFRTVLCEVALQTNELPLIVLVDEIELLRQQNFKTDEFLVGIRSFFTDRAEDPMFRRLTFCLAGSSTPDALIQNVTVTPFNIGKRIVPTDFTRAEAQPFADALSRAGRNGELLLNRALYWTSGHPYLTQRVCKAIFDMPDTRTAADVDSVVAQLYFGRDPEDGQHLSFINRRIEADPDFLMDPAALLAIYAPIYKQFGKRSTAQEDPKNHWHALLKLSGLVLPRQGMLEIRNRIYHTVFGRAWIAEHMPNAEVVRQRAARRRGFLQAALLFGTISVVMAALGWVAFSESKHAREAEARANRALYIANMNLIQHAWEAGPSQVGRMLELLEETKNSPYRGFEWGYWNRLCHLNSIILRGHNDKICSAALSADGNRIVTGSYDKTAKVWNAHTGHEILSLSGHTEPVSSVAFTLDGNRIITGSYDSTVRVWDAHTGREIIKLVNIGHNPVNAIAISPNGKQIATANGDCTAGLWDSLTGRKILSLKGHRNEVRCVAFSLDGKRIVTGSLDHTAKVWDANTGRDIVTLNMPGLRITSISFLSEDKEILTGYYDKSATLWNAQTGRQIRKLNGFVHGVGTEESVTISTDRKLTITVFDDNTGQVWNPINERATTTLRGHKDFVSAIAISSNGQRIVTGSSDGTAKIWDIKSNRPILTLSAPSGSVESVAFSPDDARIVVGVDGRPAEVYNTKTGQRILTLHTSSGTVAFKSDGSRIVTSGHDSNLGVSELNTPRVWNAQTGQQMMSLKGHSKYVMSVAFSQDGTQIVTGSYDNTAKVWDAQTGREVLTLTGHTRPVASVAFSPDGKRIVTGSWDKTARIWDAMTGKPMQTLKGHAMSVSAVAFSPDGRRIITGSFDQTAKIWDVQTGLETLTLIGHSDTVSCIAISRDGRKIVTGSRDNTAKVWEGGQ